MHEIVVYSIPSKHFVPRSRVVANMFILFCCIFNFLQIIPKWTAKVMLFSSIYQSILAQFSRRKLPDNGLYTKYIKSFVPCQRISFWLMEYRNIANKSVFLPYRTVPNLQCNIHITPLAFNVVSIEHFRIPTFQDTALATRLTIVQAFPGIEDVGSPFFWSGAFYLRWLHIIL